MKPHKCPVCDAENDDCRACNGTGVIWGPPEGEQGITFEQLLEVLREMRPYPVPTYPVQPEPWPRRFWWGDTIVPAPPITRPLTGDPDWMRYSTGSVTAVPDPNMRLMY